MRGKSRRGELLGKGEGGGRGVERWRRRGWDEGNERKEARDGWTQGREEGVASVRDIRHLDQVLPTIPKIRDLAVNLAGRGFRISSPTRARKEAHD